MSGTADYSEGSLAYLEIDHEFLYFQGLLVRVFEPSFINQSPKAPQGIFLMPGLLLGAVSLKYSSSFPCG